MLGVHLADAPGHGAVVAEGVLQHKTGHAELAGLGGLIPLQEVVQLHKGFLAVVVVGVDHRKGLLQDALAGQHGLAGAPGLGASLGHGETGGHILQRLEGVSRFHAQRFAGGLDAVADGLLEGLLDVVTDDEDDLVKAGLDGIVDGIVHDDLAVGADSRQLFDAAAEAGADAGRHDYQCRFHRNPPTFYSFAERTACGPPCGVTSACRRTAD